MKLEGLLQLKEDSGVVLGRMLTMEGKDRKNWKGRDWNGNPRVLICGRWPAGPLGAVHRPDSEHMVKVM